MNKNSNKLNSQGYIIVEKYEKIFKRFAELNRGRDKSVYGIPKPGTLLDSVLKKYRGTDRMPLDPFSDEEASYPNLIEPRREDEAQRYLSVLENNGKLVAGLVTNYHDILNAYNLINNKNAYEILSVFVADYTKNQGVGRFLGYDVSYFYSDHFSAIADSLFFPKWHGTDDGSTFKESYDKLNEYGLFDTEAEALEFLNLYASLDWTETGTFYVVGVNLAK